MIRAAELSLPFLSVRVADRVCWATIVSALPDPTEALLDEAFRFQQTLRDPLSQERMRTFLANGGQTREGELQVNKLVTSPQRPER